MRMILAFFLVFIASAANAQEALVVQNCGTLPQVYVAGVTRQPTVDVNGKLCTNALAAATPGYIATNWYRPFGVSNIAIGTANSVNVISCVYGTIAQKVTLSNIGFREQVSGTAGNAQLAIYNTINSLPGTLLASTANMSTAAGPASVTSALVPNIQVGPGGSSGNQNLWFCSNSSAPNNTFLTGSTLVDQPSAQTIGGQTFDFAGGPLPTKALTCGTTTANGACVGGTGNFGSWPATLAGTFWTYTQTTANIWPAVQIGSVP